MWKKVSSKEIFTHPRLSLIEDDVILPNGQKTKYLKYKERGPAVIIITKKNDKILILKEYAYPLNEMIFQFPGGNISLNESIESGTNRELMEEAGFKANQLDLLGSYFVESSRTKMRMYVYLATDLIEQSIDSDPEEEDIETFWFSECEIANMIKRGEILSNHSLSAWCLYMNSK